MRSMFKSGQEIQVKEDEIQQRGKDGWSLRPIEHEEVVIQKLSSAIIPTPAPVITPVLEENEDEDEVTFDESQD